MNKPIKLTNDSLMNDEEFYAAVRYNDALEAIAEGTTREEYIKMHKPAVQHLYAAAYDKAEN